MEIKSENGAFLGCIIKAGLFDKVTFELRLATWEGANHVENVPGEDTAGRENSQRGSLTVEGAQCSRSLGKQVGES